MTIAQIKEEIRRMSRSEKIEIYAWLDNSVGADSSSRMDRSGSVTSDPSRNQPEVANHH
jgi:hypothetical protein